MGQVKINKIEINKKVKKTIRLNITFLYKTTDKLKLLKFTNKQYIIPKIITHRRNVRN